MIYRLVELVTKWKILRQQLGKRARKKSDGSEWYLENSNGLEAKVVTVIY